ncbi:unnamed protein product [Darwinula stevensoni]|uniref:Transferrin-like domain-containing protein n=1 Tax=Darwinula stevensoni TaxID=69355 RepID=A0A7R8ZZ42_9CRUS|nr:unnamed protein product [Darwinula stevensoni]CAG0881773.1 unnamed protein product [Darwinula stevensoni]
MSGEEEELTWCTISDEEQEKCQDLAKAVQEKFSDFFASRITWNKPRFSYKIGCQRAVSKEECMEYLDQGIADLVSLDPGEVFLGGRYMSLVPIMQELMQGDIDHFYAVAVVKRGDLRDVHTLHDLRDKKACFAGVGSLASWSLPISILMDRRVLEIVDCNNHVKSASEFFGTSCAVNALDDKFNPLGDNSNKLCEICAESGEGHGQYCSSGDPFAGYEGALQCLRDKGDIAFLKHSTVELVAEVPESGQEDPDVCDYDVTPTCEAARLLRTDTPDRIDPLTGRHPFDLFSSAYRYNKKHNLLFEDKTRKFLRIPVPQQSYKDYLKDSLDHILRVRHCPVPSMRLCVVSDHELSKCIRMMTALRAQLLQPELSCFKGHDSVDCMKAIARSEADVAVVDAGDVYTAGKNYELIPVLVEQYNLDTPEYYAVAVTWEEDPDTDILYLKGRYTCHSGIMHAAGWVLPMAYLINNDRIRPYGCDSIRAAAEFFSKSCVPGVSSSDYNFGKTWNNLCDLCHGASHAFCSRDPSEDFFGHTGAFRCLVEGGGNVAFVKHTTVLENTDGKRRQFWARNQINTDFQLLCRNGKRVPVQEYEHCNLGKVKGNAVITRGGSAFNQTQVDAFLNLFIYAQSFYGLKFGDDFSFKMFSSEEPYADLIFQDATQQLVVVPEEERDYESFLGEEFLHAMRTVNCRAGRSVLPPILSVIILPSITSFMLRALL